MAGERPGRVIRFVERVVLGAGMTLAAIIVERKLRNATRTKEPEEAPDLTLGPKQVEDESRG